MENLSFGSNLIGIISIFLASSLVFVILITYEVYENINIKTKNILIIAIILIFGFISYSNFKINKLHNKGELFALANREEILTNTEYISEKEIINDLDYNAVSINDNSYIILIDDNNEVLKEKVYYKTHSNIILTNKEENSNRVETYSLNKIYKVNDKLLILDKLAFKFLNIFIDLDEYKHIETIKNYNYKIFVSEDNYNYIKNAESEMNLAKS